MEYKVGNPAPAAGGVSASAALAVGKQTDRKYIPRIVHIPWETVHTLIGVASHVAYLILAERYKSIRLTSGKKGDYSKFAEHKRLTGELMKKWCWELAQGLIAEQKRKLGLA